MTIHENKKKQTVDNNQPWLGALRRLLRLRRAEGSELDGIHNFSSIISSSILRATRRLPPLVTTTIATTKQ